MMKCAEPLEAKKRDESSHLLLALPLPPYTSRPLFFPPYPLLSLFFRHLCEKDGHPADSEICAAGSGVWLVPSTIGAVLDASSSAAAGTALPPTSLFVLLFSGFLFHAFRARLQTTELLGHFWLSASNDLRNGPLLFFFLLWWSKASPRNSIHQSERGADNRFKNRRGIARHGSQRNVHCWWSR